MLTILLVDTELEIIPDEMQDDYAIRLHAKKRKKSPSEILLDSNFMHTAIERHFPGQSNRRGRPDIVYHFMQVVMDSILNKKGGLSVWIHTRSDKIISISPQIRIPRSYNRFVGLMEDLFKKGALKADEVELMKIFDGDVAKLIKISGSSKPIILSPHGEPCPVTELFASRKEDQAVIIGGFSEGDFISDVYKPGNALKIYHDELTIWSVAMEIIAQYERDFNFLSI